VITVARVVTRPAEGDILQQALTSRVCVRGASALRLIGNDDLGSNSI